MQDIYGNTYHHCDGIYVVINSNAFSFLRCTGDQRNAEKTQEKAVAVQKEEV